MPKSIVRQYCEKYPEMPTRTLAKLIFKENPLKYGNVEYIRTMINRERGTCGEAFRKNKRDKSLFKTSKEVDLSPFHIPKPESLDTEPLILPPGQNNIGIISDLHMPNHRVEPIQLALSHFDERKINTLLINGDLLDNTPFTKHDGKRPSADDVKRWFDQGEYFLEYLRHRFPDAAIYWLEGNHDFWYRRWLNAHAWQLDNDPYYTLQARLHLDDYNINWVPQERYIKAGKLNICHGHFLIRGIITPVNAARGVYLKAKKSTLIGHVHVESSHTETDIEGDIVTTWSTGCLCTLTPEYMPMAGKACHGFAHVEVKANGDFHVTNVRIHKDQVL